MQEVRCAVVREEASSKCNPQHVHIVILDFQYFPAPTIARVTCVVVMQRGRGLRCDFTTAALFIMHSWCINRLGTKKYLFHVIIQISHQTLMMSVSCNVHLILYTSTLAFYTLYTDSFKFSTI